MLFGPRRVAKPCRLLFRDSLSPTPKPLHTVAVNPGTKVIALLNPGREPERQTDDRFAETRRQR